jgi:hypothetical protein
MAHLDGDVVTLFWQYPSVPIQDLILAMLPIRPDQQTRSVIGPNQPNREPNFGNAPNFGHDLLRSENWHFPKKCWKCQIPILYGVSQITSRFTVDWYFLTRANIPPTHHSTARGWWRASAKKDCCGYIYIYNKEHFLPLS